MIRTITPTIQTRGSVRRIARRVCFERETSRNTHNFVHFSFQVQSCIAAALRTFEWLSLKHIFYSIVSKVISKSFAMVVNVQAKGTNDRKIEKSIARNTKKDESSNPGKAAFMHSNCVLPN
jgi:hypothetical protein